MSPIMRDFLDEVQYTWDRMGGSTRYSLYFILSIKDREQLL